MTGQALSPILSPTRADAPLHHGPAAVRLYSRIREDIRARIVSGAWQPHDRLPSESELMGLYGVSRITVRQALGDLQKERVIFKVAGKGSFVSPSKPFQELGRLQGFAEAMTPTTACWPWARCPRLKKSPSDGHDRGIYPWAWLRELSADIARPISR